MSFSINIDHENKLIRYEHSGILNKEDIGAAWVEFLKIEEFVQQKYNLLSDYSDAKFDIDIPDIELITEFLFSIKDILNAKKQALILSESRSTALSFLFSEDVNKKLGFKVSVFSTEKAAINWLKY